MDADSEKTTPATTKNGEFLGADCRKIFTVYLIVIGLIFSYQAYLHMLKGKGRLTRKDWMNRTIFTNPGGGAISWWPISHAVLNFALGFIFPHEWRFILISGILWELIEVVFGYVTRNHPIRKRSPNNSKPRVQYEEQWWQGSFQDVVFNALGLTAGLLARQMITGR